MKYYAAYGSNLDLTKMASRCPSAHAVAAGLLEDYQLEFRGSEKPYLTIRPSKGHHVPIGIFSVQEADEHNLDVYEDYPVLYYKKQISCTATSFENKKETIYDAFIYIMQDGHPIAMPSSAYIDTVLQGYHDFNFDEAILTAALDEARKAKN